MTCSLAARRDGIDVSLEYSSVCVVDADVCNVQEANVLSEPDALIAWFDTYARRWSALVWGPPLVAMTACTDGPRKAPWGWRACWRLIEGIALPLRHVATQTQDDTLQL